MRLIAAVAVVALAALVAPPLAGSSPARARRQISVLFAGDVLLHEPVNAAAAGYAKGEGQAYDYRPMFARIAPLVAAADLAVCHLETPVAPPGERLSGYPTYGVPAEIAPALATAGFDRCSTASNHSLDRGPRGIAATLDALDAAGLGHSGTARGPEEAEPHVFWVGDVPVAHLSYAETFNGLRLPANAPWAANAMDVNRILADAGRARELGAAIVIVSLHWGTEYQQSPTATQARVAETLTASNLVDLVVGHHAHVLQPIAGVNGRWVVFGLGNLLSNQRGPYRQDGALVSVEFVERAGGRGFDAGTPVVMPTWVQPGSFVIHPTGPSLADGTLGRDVHAQLVASHERTMALLGPFVTGSVVRRLPVPAPRLTIGRWQVCPC